VVRPRLELGVRIDGSIRLEMTRLIEVRIPTKPPTYSEMIARTLPG
jgi:hypothetical protein